MNIKSFLSLILMTLCLTFFLLGCKKKPTNVDCSECDGNGYIIVRCQTCDGEGSVECPECNGVVPIVMEVAQMLLVTIATHVQAQATKNALGVGVEDIKIAPFVMAEVTKIAPGAGAEATRIARTVTEQVALSAKIARTWESEGRMS